MYGVPDFYQNDNVKKGTGMQWRHQVVSDLPSYGYGTVSAGRWTIDTEGGHVVVSVSLI